MSAAGTYHTLGIGIPSEPVRFPVFLLHSLFLPADWVCSNGLIILVYESTVGLVIAAVPVGSKLSA
jgi:hypothetical protein